MGLFRVDRDGFDPLVLPKSKIEIPRGRDFFFIRTPGVGEHKMTGTLNMKAHFAYNEEEKDFSWKGGKLHLLEQGVEKLTESRLKAELNRACKCCKRHAESRANQVIAVNTMRKDTT